MSRYELVDEAVIDGTPREVWQALIDEIQGRSCWGLPYCRMEQRGTLGPDEVGGLIELAANDRGHLDSRLTTARMTARVVEVETGKRLLTDYIGGDFRGSAEWTLEPVGETRTLLRLVWRTNPHGLLRLTAPFMDIAGGHSEVTRKSFIAIGEYVASTGRAQGGG